MSGDSISVKNHDSSYYLISLNKSVLIDVGEDGEILEGSDLYSHYNDVRFELACLGGHNLVFILVSFEYRKLLYLDIGANESAGNIIR